MNITQAQFQSMVEGLTSDMVQHLIEKEQYTLKEALDTVYNSELYAALNRPKTGLYNQSAGYVIEYLMRELKYGKLQ